MNGRLKPFSDGKSYAIVIFRRIVFLFTNEIISYAGKYFQQPVVPSDEFPSGTYTSAKRENDVFFG